MNNSAQAKVLSYKCDEVLNDGNLENNNGINSQNQPQISTVKMNDWYKMQQNSNNNHTLPPMIKQKKETNQKDEIYDQIITLYKKNHENSNTKKQGHSKSNSWNKYMENSKQLKQVGIGFNLNLNKVSDQESIIKKGQSLNKNLSKSIEEQGDIENENDEDIPNYHKQIQQHKHKKPTSFFTNLLAQTQRLEKKKAQPISYNLQQHVEQKKKFPPILFQQQVEYKLKKHQLDSKKVENKWIEALEEQEQLEEVQNQSQFDNQDQFTGSQESIEKVNGIKINNNQYDASLLENPSQSKIIFEQYQKQMEKIKQTTLERNKSELIINKNKTFDQQQYSNQQQQKYQSNIRKKRININAIPKPVDILIRDIISNEIGKQTKHKKELYCKIQQEKNSLLSLQQNNLHTLGNEQLYPSQISQSSEYSLNNSMNLNINNSNNSYNNSNQKLIFNSPKYYSTVKKSESFHNNGMSHYKNRSASFKKPINLNQPFQYKTPQKLDEINENKGQNSIQKQQITPNKLNLINLKSYRKRTNAKEYIPIVQREKVGPLTFLLQKNMQESSAKKQQYQKQQQQQQYQQQYQQQGFLEEGPINLSYQSDGMQGKEYQFGRKMVSPIKTSSQNKGLEEFMNECGGRELQQQKSVYAGIGGMNGKYSQYKNFSEKFNNAAYGN